MKRISNCDLLKREVSQTELSARPHAPGKQVPFAADEHDVVVPARQLLHPHALFQDEVALEPVDGPHDA